jgi:glutamyl-tRNA reductase
LKVLLADDAIDLAYAEDTRLERTRALLAGAGVGAAVIHAALVGHRVATTVVRNAHVDLLRVDAAVPQEIERSVNLLQIRVRPNLGA